MMKIYIDVGHGGSEQSMVANGLAEKNVNLAVAIRLRKILIDEGLDVLMSRYDDTNIGAGNLLAIDVSAGKCNAWSADFAYSIHHNGFNAQVFGYDLIYSPFKADSLKMANAIGEELNAAGRPKHGISTKTYVDDFGVTRDWYGIIREISCPCIICEYCYMDTPSEAALVDTVPETDAEAMLIARGILKNLGMAMPKVAQTNPIPLPITTPIATPEKERTTLEAIDWLVAKRSINKQFWLDSLKYYKNDIIGALLIKWANDVK